MSKNSNIWEIALYYICTIVIITFTILTYISKVDQTLLVLQSIVVLISIINSIRVTVKYIRTNK